MSNPLDSEGLESEIANTADMVLARQAQNGDRIAWQQLIDRHAGRLCAYLGARLRRHRLVTKLVGDTIFAAWRHMSEWAPSQEDFATWFRRIGARIAMGWRQKNPEEPLSEEFPADLCEDEGMLATMRQLEEALGSLPEDMRMCLEQYFRAGLGGKALGDVLHLGDQDAMALLDRSLDALAEAMDRQSPA